MIGDEKLSCFGEVIEAILETMDRPPIERNRDVGSALMLYKDVKLLIIAKGFSQSSTENVSNLKTSIREDKILFLSKIMKNDHSNVSI